MLKRLRKELGSLRKAGRSLSRRASYVLGVGPPEYAFRIRTRLTDAEKVLLFKTARRLPICCAGLEVGSYIGASACFIGSAIKGRRGKLHCVDTWTNKGMDEGERDTWAEFAENTARLRNVIIPHRGLSLEVAEDFSVVLDFLFIDADHSDEAVDADARAWLPKVRPGGIVAMHDIGYEAVQKAVDRYFRGKMITEAELPNLLICRTTESGPQVRQFALA